METSRSPTPPGRKRAAAGLAAPRLRGPRGPRLRSRAEQRTRGSPSLDGVRDLHRHQPGRLGLVLASVSAVGLCSGHRPAAALWPPWELHACAGLDRVGPAAAQGGDIMLEGSGQTLENGSPPPRPPKPPLCKAQRKQSCSTPGPRPARRCRPSARASIATAEIDLTSAGDLIMFSFLSVYSLSSFVCPGAGFQPRSWSK